MATALDVESLETGRHLLIKDSSVEDGSWALKDILENAPFRIGVRSLPLAFARRLWRQRTVANQRRRATQTRPGKL
jgi:hypothetical protein